MNIACTFLILLEVLCKAILFYESALSDLSDKSIILHTWNARSIFSLIHKNLSRCPQKLFFQHLYGFSIGIIHVIHILIHIFHIFVWFHAVLFAYRNCYRHDIPYLAWAPGWFIILNFLDDACRVHFYFRRFRLLRNYGLFMQVIVRSMGMSAFRTGSQMRGGLLHSLLMDVPRESGAAVRAVISVPIGWDINFSIPRRVTVFTNSYSHVLLLVFSSLVFVGICP